jgi:hypothetical protein
MTIGTNFFPCLSRHSPSYQDDDHVGIALPPLAVLQRTPPLILLLFFVSFVPFVVQSFSIRFYESQPFP